LAVSGTSAIAAWAIISRSIDGRRSPTSALDVAREHRAPLLGQPRADQRSGHIAVDRRAVGVPDQSSRAGVIIWTSSPSAIWHTSEVSAATSSARVSCRTRAAYCRSSRSSGPSPGVRTDHTRATSATVSRAPSAPSNSATPTIHAGHGRTT
jgi:hypothetical protein